MTAAATTATDVATRTRRVRRRKADLLTSLLAAASVWLAAWAWQPFSTTPSAYLLPLAVSCLLVAVVGAALRDRRLPWPSVLAAQLVVVVLWLCWAIAPEPSLLHPVASLRSAGEVLSNAVDIARTVSSPVPARMRDFFAFPLVAGSVCALLADLLACGLRIAPTAGMVLLGMYTVPAGQIDGDIPVVEFALIAVAFAATLWAAGLRDQPLSERPERPERPEQSGRPGRPGRPGRLGLAGLRPALAIVAPAVIVASLLAGLVPTLPRSHLIGSGGSGTGGTTIRLTDPSLDLKRNLVRGADVPLVYVATTAADPSYLRMSVLDLFEDGQWKPGLRQLPSTQIAHGPLPNPVGLDAGRLGTAVTSWTIATTSRFGTAWLPLPFPASYASVVGDWRYDASTMDVVHFSRQATRGGITYTAQTRPVTVTAANLDAAGSAPAGILTRYADATGIPSWIRDLAQQVTARGQTSFQKAVLLQRWFTQPHANPATDPDFTYSLDVQADGSSLGAISDFLRGSRTGYCEQFAGAMALMARSLGIPARIAVGFLDPDPLPDTQGSGVPTSIRYGAAAGEGWVYSSHDEHAWPELYFQGTGWVRFEPTPGWREGATSPSYTASVSIGDSDPSTETTTTTDPTTTEPAPAAPETAAPAPTTTTTTSTLASPWLSARRIGWLVALLLLLVAGAAPPLLRRRIRARRWSRAARRSGHTAAEVAWSELRDSLVDRGVPFDRATTVRKAAAGVAARLPRHDDTAAAALDRIVDVVERARYSTADVVVSVADLRHDVERCVAAARVWAPHGWSGLLRRWLPASLLDRDGWRVDVTPAPRTEREAQPVG